MDKKSGLFAVVLAAGWTAVAMVIAMPDAATQTPPTTAAIMAGNIETAGGAAALAKVRSLSFAAGPLRYTAAADGRMKVRTAFAEDAVFESVLVGADSVRVNSLGRVRDATGFDRDRWIVLARLAGGAFTLRGFAGSLTFEATKSFGPERQHVLNASVGGLRVEFFVDTADFRLKRVLLAGTDDAGAARQESLEFGEPAAANGVSVPSALYAATVGVGGTYAPGPRPLENVKINEDLPAGFFDDFGVHAGATKAEAGRLEGNVLGGQFEDEDLFVRVFTNWTDEDVQTAGFKNGDVLVLSSGGAEFETKLYRLESQVDDATVYDPGKSIFTHLPERYPVYYAQFNSLSPKERYDGLKARIKILAPIQARRR